jgi:hypothetical protein
MNCSLGGADCLRSRYVLEGVLCRTHPASSTKQVKTDFKGYVADLALPGMTTSTTPDKGDWHISTNSATFLRRVRDFNSRGFKEQCRGFARNARAVH